MRLTDNIDTIKGIGDKTALLFSKASVFCVNDLLHYFPRNYILTPEIKNISDIKEGENCIISATVCKSPSFVSTKSYKKLFTFEVTDKSANLRISYFGMPYMKNHFLLGKTVMLQGVVKKVKNILSMNNPKIISNDEYLRDRGKLIPIYPLSKGLSNKIIQNSIRNIFDNEFLLNDYLDEKIRDVNNLLDINEAIKLIHFPESMEDVYKARRRLAFDEFFFFLLNINLLKKDKGVVKNNYPIKDFTFVNEIITKLPYKLTNGQNAAIEDIKKDLSSGYLMNRLIQGDVGCGKTIVAILASLMAIKDGHQAVIMAPTEVLARQHFADIERMVNDFNLDFVKPVLLVGSLKASEKKKIQQGITDNLYNFIIGTHAVIQDKVNYHDLYIAVTDEQHRFGVKQRLSLMNANNNVNVLVMSATPIPRTLGLIIYGDLDVSVIKELPANRLPIKNTVVGESYREKLYQFIYKRITEGRQAYIICPMVEEGELDNVANVLDYTESIRQIFPKSVNIASLHGKMKALEKDEIMNSFKNNDIQILVSTTVVEVGVNVPNATVIMIENAERFGLASLHQLRGRVGRGNLQSYCIFLSGNDSEKTMKKLEILGKSNDGFEIASEDLKQRGPGDFFGIKQSGLPDFKIADIYTDADVLSLAKNLADDYIASDSNRINDIFSKIDNKENPSLLDFHYVCL